MLTLRQIEVVRAVMVAGTIAGAARLLNVAQPGISRTMKHMEASLGIKLFIRKGGRYVPSPEAVNVFGQLQEVHKKIEDLQFTIGQLERGRGVELSFGSVPSIANVMVPRAIAATKHRYPDIRIDIDILKIEDAIDYLMLGRGEFAAMSYRFDHPSILFEPLAKGHLVCIAGPDHPFASRPVVAAAEIAGCPLIGIDPNDPYGGIMAGIFARENLDYEITIRARFGTTVLALIKQGLGVAVIDAFTVADMNRSEIAVVPIAEPTEFQTYIARRGDVALSSFAESLIRDLRQIMNETTAQQAMA
ncbi:LysR family transcriptional regulator [Chelativorans salis]|uniref:LysR family transcriptional regulator n=1 Tax=Chelativorans salis TaxID=2978478 RepID=A0ABT2LI51_9HYPH|nr:LysR family transcriptional regulator [Chelativorans sp. EGI FJ00035]MCT7374190.1 LysR family transcriptional regulator [Chelativorans sp. EGI FJ00035]